MSGPLARCLSLGCLAALASCGGAGALATDPLAPIPTDVAAEEVEPPPLRVEWKQVPRSTTLGTLQVRRRGQTPLFPPPTRSPALDATLVYATYGDLIRAHDIRDGALRWEARLAADVVLPPIPVAGGIAVATAEGRWLWVDLAGRVRAASDPGPVPVDAVGIPEGILSVDRTGVSFIDAAQLAQAPVTRWREALAGAVAISAAPDGFTGIVVADDGAIVAYAAANGSVRWRNDEVVAIPAGTAVDDRRVYVVGRDDRVHALRLTDGKRDWIGKQTGVRAVGAPAVAGRLVWVAALDAALHAFDTGNGSHMFRVPLSGRSYLDLVRWGPWIVASPEYGPWAVVRGPLFANSPADPGQPRRYTISSDDDLHLAPGSGIAGIAAVNAGGTVSFWRPRQVATPAAATDQR